MAFLCIFTVLFGIIFVAYGDLIEVYNCKNTPTEFVHVSNVHVTPMPIVLGKKASISLTGRSKLPVEHGTTVEISATHFIFTYACPGFEHFCIDVCDTLAKNSSTCSKPDGGKCGNCVLPPGEYNIFYDIQTPNVPLRGEGTVKVEIFDKSRKLLACVEGKGNFTIG